MLKHKIIMHLNNALSLYVYIVYWLSLSIYIFIGVLILSRVKGGMDEVSLEEAGGLCMEHVIN